MTLFAFAVAQGVYDILTSNPEFLTARRVTNPQLLEIVAVYGLLPAIVLGVVWAFSHRFSPGAHRGLFCAMIGVFSLALFWQARYTYLGDGEGILHSPWLWVAPSLALAIVAWRKEASLRTFLLALSPAILIFPALFLSRAWRSPIAPPQMEVSAEASTVLTPDFSPNGTPVVFLVFDELGLHALLNGEGKIDPGAYPNFARLASGSHWFRNATSNSSKTLTAITAMATGNLPQGIDPNHANYPNTLFSLLAPSYDIYIEEVGYTHFCDSEAFQCLNDATGDGTIGLLRDVGYLFAGRVVPAKLDIGLPDTSHTWGPFQSADNWTQAALARARRVLHAVDAIPGKNALFFSHLILPHSPYALTPEGEIYALGPYGIDEGQDAATLSSLIERYRMQVRFVDRWLGRFLDRLEQRGLYDPALLIVTGDHGVSWKAEAPGRTLRRENAEMMLSVPLLVKLPFQKEAAYSERDVQHIDLLPTIAAALDMHLPFPVEGRDVFGPETAERRKVAIGDGMERFEFDDRLGLRPVAVHAQGSALLDESIEQFKVVEDAWVRGKLQNVQIAPADAPDFAATMPVMVSGWALQLDPAGPMIGLRPGGRSGENALAFRGVDGGARQLLSGLAAGGRYVARAWVRSGSDAAGAATLRIATGRGSVFEAAKLSPSREFQPVEAAFTAPADGQVLVELNYTGAPGQVFWDDVSVVPFGSALNDAPNEAAPADASAEHESPEVVANGGFEEPLGPPWQAYGVDPHGAVPQAGEIAVTVNGRIAAAARPGAERWDVATQLLVHPHNRYLRCGWSVSIPMEKLEQGENRLEAYLVLDPKRRIAVRLDSGWPRGVIRQGDTLKRMQRVDPE